MIGAVGALMKQFGPTTSASAPNTPTLSIVDNGDGTGAVATVSGSSAGSSNAVYTAPWTGSGDLTWTLGGTRTGNGTVALSLVNDFYVAKCESTLNSVGPIHASNEPVFSTTGGATYVSAHKALAEHVKTTIQGMLGTDIVGPSSDSVRVRKCAYLADFTSQSPLPDAYHYSLPGIVVCYFDFEEINRDEGTNARDDIGYPLTIVFAQSTQDVNTASEANDDAFLRWREAIIGTFNRLRNARPLTVTANAISYTFHDCFVRGGLILDPNRSIENKLDVGWMRLSFILRRGKINT